MFARVMLPCADKEAEQAVHEAAGVAQQAGKALEQGFASVVQAPRHLAEKVRHQVWPAQPPLLFLLWELCI